MNLDDLINRVISVAQASGEAKRNTALEISKLNADTYKEKSANDLAVAGINADAHRYDADSRTKVADAGLKGQMYTADQHVRGEDLRAGAQVQAAGMGLLGQVAHAGATSHAADVQMAVPYLRGDAQVQAEKISLPPGAPVADQRLANDTNARLDRVSQRFTENPAVVSARRGFDPSANVRDNASTLGLGLRGTGSAFGAQTQPTQQLATQRLPSYGVSAPTAPPLSPLRPSPGPSLSPAPAGMLGGSNGGQPDTSLLGRKKTQDPSRIGFSY